ncbi:hypothetical protein [Actinomadura rayongensis]|uniref:Cyclase n=1 Tax=Actinomadura rayongensis TaxID=1429076 RepID=A0A6I4WCF8_9ACTN|nr:hypothetical protein [Actinomadura rayongensis]MXQ64432.1 hypothetical protein [Actinomadura rayongensis]
MPTKTNLGRSVALGALATVGALAFAAPAHAAAPSAYTFTTTAQTSVTGLGADFTLGPGEAKIQADLASGEVSSGTFTLPEARSDFNMFGFLPTHAKVKITQVGDIKGTLKDGAVDVTTKVNVQITQVGHFGIPIFDYPDCKTTKPADLHLTSKGAFDPATGGTLTATYKLPEVSGCFIDTPVINFLTGGKDNPLTIKLAAAQ